MEQVRQAIREDRLLDFRDEFMMKYYGSTNPNQAF
jgi:queuine tRNA-ribosyltransferase